MQTDLLKKMNIIHDINILPAIKLKYLMFLTFFFGILNLA